MTSIRTKLTFSLLVMSFVAIAVVGMTARWMTLGRFDRLVVERAFEGFEREIGSYYEAYGSWDAARSAESFYDFASRLRSGRSQWDNPPPRSRQRPPPNAPDSGPQPADRRFEMGGPPPSFFVIDRDGTVVLPLADREVGELATPSEIARAMPIVLRDEEIGFAVAAERPVLTAVEEQYLAATQSALLWSLLMAAALAIPLGLILGSRFAAPIRELTGAIRDMGGGALRQSVRVRSSDEIGQLSSAFNRMSEELATAYDELEASRAHLREQAELLGELSRRDDLTQLLNRRAFNESMATLIAQARRYGHPLTLALADIDHFKNVNDDHSHGIGDAVLRDVSKLITLHLREVDVVARYGGEEFAIAFPETDVPGAAHLAERLRAIVAKHDWESLSPGLSVTLSVGLANGFAEQDFQDVLAAADAKLYEAKAAGRNQVRF